MAVQEDTREAIEESRQLLQKAATQVEREIAADLIELGREILKFNKMVEDAIEEVS